MVFINILMVNQNCSYFSAFLKTLQKNLKIKVGIATQDSSWARTFGDRNACKQLGAYNLLWYYIGTDFKPFGGWTSCDLKIGEWKKKCGVSVLDIVLSQKKFGGFGKGFRGFR